MKIKSIETFRLPEYRLSVWVRITTEDGMVGYGESTNEPIVTEAAIHHFMAPMLVGHDVENMEDIWHRAYDRANYQGNAGAEIRALSAIDIALWDLRGKALGQPLYALLGGKVRDSVKVYNTCGNHGGRDIGIRDSSRFLEDAGALAKELLDSGITGMKIWPFDPLAAATRGQSISHADLQKGLEPVKKIRDAVGGDMDIMMELHSLWNLPSSIRIANALEPYDIRWLEDAVNVDDVSNLAELHSRTSIPVLASERLLTRWQYRPLLEKSAADVVMVDLSWTGGISEGKKIAAMADAYRLPITTHNCGGPVLTRACAHFCISTVNAIEMETVRAIYLCFPDVSASAFDIRGGRFHLDDAPGLGVDFKPETFARADIAYQKTDLG